MIMKKILLFINLIWFTTLINAQGFGIQLGLNSAKFANEFTRNFKYENVEENKTKTINTSAKTGLNIGVNYDIELMDNLYIQPGIYYSQKGTEINGKDIDGNWLKKIKLSYMDLSILIKYKFELTDEVNLLALAGPSLNYGLSGEDVFIQGKYNDEDEIVFSSDYDEALDNSDTILYKKSYTGMNIGLGAEYNKIEFKINYSFALSNTTTYGSAYGHDDYKQNVFSINLGYRFMD